MSGVLLITGASRGIGAATALLGAQRGYAVCVNYVRDHAAARGVVESVESRGGVARRARLVPMRRGGQPEEVAQAILWLLSEQASYVTGTFIELAGGC